MEQITVNYGSGSNQQQKDADKFAREGRGVSLIPAGDFSDPAVQEALMQKLNEELPLQLLQLKHEEAFSRCSAINAKFLRKYQDERAMRNLIRRKPNIRKLDFKRINNLPIPLAEALAEIQAGVVELQHFVETHSVDTADLIHLTQTNQKYHFDLFKEEEAFARGNDIVLFSFLQRQLSRQKAAREQGLEELEDRIMAATSREAKARLGLTIEQLREELLGKIEETDQRARSDLTRQYKEEVQRTVYTKDLIGPGEQYNSLGEYLLHSFTTGKAKEKEAVAQHRKVLSEFTALQVTVKSKLEQANTAVWQTLKDIKSDLEQARDIQSTSSKTLMLSINSMRMELKDHKLSKQHEFLYELQQTKFQELQKKVVEIEEYMLEDHSKQASSSSSSSLPLSKPSDLKNINHSRSSSGKKSSLSSQNVIEASSLRSSPQVFSQLQQQESEKSLLSVIQADSQAQSPQKKPKSSNHISDDKDFTCSASSPREQNRTAILNEPESGRLSNSQDEQASRSVVAPESLTGKSQLLTEKQPIRASDESADKPISDDLNSVEAASCQHDTNLRGAAQNIKSNSSALGTAEQSQQSKINKLSQQTYSEAPQKPSRQNSRAFDPKSGSKNSYHDQASLDAQSKQSKIKASPTKQPSSQHLSRQGSEGPQKVANLQKQASQDVSIRNQASAQLQSQTLPTQKSFSPAQQSQNEGMAQKGLNSPAPEQNLVRAFPQQTEANQKSSKLLSEAPINTVDTKRQEDTHETPSWSQEGNLELPKKQIQTSVPSSPDQDTHVKVTAQAVIPRADQGSESALVAKRAKNGFESSASKPDQTEQALKDIQQTSKVLIDTSLRGVTSAVKQKAPQALIQEQQNGTEQPADGLQILEGIQAIQKPQISRRSQKDGSLSPLAGVASEEQPERAAAPQMEKPSSGADAHLTSSVKQSAFALQEQQKHVDSADVVTLHQNTVESTERMVPPERTSNQPAPVDKQKDHKHGLVNQVVAQALKKSENSRKHKPQPPAAEKSTSKVEPLNLNKAINNLVGRKKQQLTAAQAAAEKEMSSKQGHKRVASNAIDTLQNSQYSSQGENKLLSKPAAKHKDGPETPRHRKSHHSRPHDDKHPKPVAAQPKPEDSLQTPLPHPSRDRRQSNKKKKEQNLNQTNGEIDVDDHASQAQLLPSDKRGGLYGGKKQKMNRGGRDDKNSDGVSDLRSLVASHTLQLEALSSIPTVVLELRSKFNELRRDLMLKQEDAIRSISHETERVNKQLKFALFKKVQLGEQDAAPADFQNLQDPLLPTSPLFARANQVTTTPSRKGANSLTIRATDTRSSGHTSPPRTSQSRPFETLSPRIQRNMFQNTKTLQSYANEKISPATDVNPQLLSYPQHAKHMFVSLEPQNSRFNEDPRKNIDEEALLIAHTRHQMLKGKMLLSQEQPTTVNSLMNQFFDLEQKRKVEVNKSLVISSDRVRPGTQANLGSSRKKMQGSARGFATSQQWMNGFQDQQQENLRRGIRACGTELNGGNQQDAVFENSRQQQVAQLSKSGGAKLPQQTPTGTL